MLKVRNITKTFNSGTVNQKTAIDDISLDLEKGEFVTVVGSNGAGKSTFLNAIAGSFFVDEGSVILDGMDLTFTSEHKRSRVIGRVFQNPFWGTAPGMTVEENLALAAFSSRPESGFALKGIRKESRFYLKEYLSLLGMGLEDRMGQEVGLLSGGQRQALTLLMAIVNQPKMLLLDEHTAALDPLAAQTILHLTKEFIQDKGLTCIMITHNMEQALGIGNRTLMMDQGKIVLDIKDPERSSLTVEDLLRRFRESIGKPLDDRVLLSVQS